jgi:hypothetical protein
MKRIKQLGILVAIIAIIISCKKDVINNDCTTSGSIVYEDDCVPYPDPPEFFLEWPIAIPDDIIYMTGDVNPLNDDEFCVMQSLGLYTQRILIYNRATDEINTLIEGYFNETLWWMVDDWIVYFDFYSGKLKRIKRDGSEIQDVFPSSGLRPKRNYEHTQLLCQVNTMTYIVEGTSILDSIPHGFDLDGDWDHPSGKLIYPDYDHIVLYDNLDSDPVIIPIETEHSISDVKWCDNYSKILWVSDEGWFKTNPSTSETYQIRENCDSKSFRIRAHVGDDLLVRQLYRMPYDGDTLLTTGKMGLFKCDGSQIELFDIPQ